LAQAARLAENGRRVVLLEAESQPGYHTTGRSAAVFAPGYGPAPIRALTRASEAFFTEPPNGFVSTPLLSARGALMIARADQQDKLDAYVAELSATNPLEPLDAAATRAANPLLRQGYAQAGVLDRSGQDIDVAALHQGFLRQFKAAGGVLVTGAQVSEMTRANGQWSLVAPVETYTADIVVNAAGAWADEIGTLAGAERIGLTPKRRTALTIDAPDVADLNAIPITIDIEEQFYLKPDAGRLLISPADETPSPATDAQPEELDIAICVDRIETAFDLSVQRIASSWAGLRSFVPDKCPVAGFSSRVDGFFWLAGQGGYGIQTCPALSELSACLIQGQSIPDYILDSGLDPDDLSPERLA
jgi:D-arginine dehydrogenase